jgi:hypothetical protein
MSIQARIEKRLASPNIEQFIDRLIHRPKNRLEDMIVFAEWLEIQHNCGFVVYWSYASDSFEVCSAEEWETAQDKQYNCPSHWRTSLCDELLDTPLEFFNPINMRGV